MSSHSTAAMRSTLASISSASRSRYGRRPSGPSAAQPSNAARGGGNGCGRLVRPAGGDAGEHAAVDRAHVVEALGGRDPLAADEVVGADRDAGDLGDRLARRGGAHSSRQRFEVVDRVAEREPKALADPHRGKRGVLLVGRLEQLEGRLALPDLRARCGRSRASARARARPGLRGCPCRAAGRWRTLTIGGSLWVGPRRSDARASPWPRRGGGRWRRRCRAKREPARRPGSARVSRPKVRVIHTEPSFFGKPWIQPRARAKSRSTQM